MIAETAISPLGRLKIKPSLQYFLLPIIVFIITSVPGVNSLTPIIALITIGALAVLRFLRPVSFQIQIALWVLLVLALVGSTGWFFSPFFFALYLTGIALGFLYSLSTAVWFTIALILTFAFSIGEINPTADFLTLLSLFSVIPITLVLRRNFLVVQQEKKGILILEPEEKKPGVTSLDAVMANRVNQLAVLIRQPLTYLRQGLALMETRQITTKELPAIIQKMQRAVDSLFTTVKEFESGTTKNVLLGRGANDKNKEG